MPVVITLIIVIFLVFISWTWHNLGNIDKTKKIITIIVSIFIIFILTSIIFNLSKQGMPYRTEEEIGTVRNVLVILFTFINGLIVMPAISKIFGKIYEKEIEIDKAQKRLIFILIIFFIIMIFEYNYMKNIQQEILRIYINAIQAK